MMFFGIPTQFMDARKSYINMVSKPNQGLKP